MSDSAAAAVAAAAARRWLDYLAGRGRETRARGELRPAADLIFSPLCLSELKVCLAEAGRVLCSFRIPSHLADVDGSWQAGAIATVIDCVGAAAILTVVGHIKVSVDFDISYFSPAKIKEEVTIEARLAEHKGKLSAVAVEVRKKGSGELVALASQWMASAQPRGHQLRSNL